MFEYLSTDLKKWMDKTGGGKGPAFPLPLGTVKVGWAGPHHLRLAGTSLFTIPLLPCILNALQNLMYQLVKGLAHCHKHGVMHRDLKPQNLLVDDVTLCLKIADLGLGRAFSIPVKSYTHEVRGGGSAAWNWVVSERCGT